MTRVKISAAFLLATFFFLVAKGETPRDRAVLANVKIYPDSSFFKIEWKQDSNAKIYKIYEKPLDGNDWGEPIVVLDSFAQGVKLPKPTQGSAREFKIWKTSEYFDSVKRTYDGYVYLCVGNEIESGDYYGRALLLIDETIADSLKREIFRFEKDIIGDGWALSAVEVPRTEKFDGAAVLKIKRTIDSVAAASSEKLEAVVILGRVAVPYSGDFAADGHKNHRGAWVADSYYADLDGEWTDESAFDTLAERKENRNVPGDGKFDQNQIPSDAELAVGRIDFYGIRKLGKTEIELLRGYLDKNHNFRTGRLSYASRGIIDDNFGMYGEAFASCAWMNFSALLGADSSMAGDFVDSVGSKINLWIYGCGAGSNYGVSGAISLEDLSSKIVPGVFSALFGSYNGDWDNPDNILVSCLASDSPTLTCSWAGRPFWHFHRMSIGEPIGFSARLSLNNQYLYRSSGLYGYRFTHVSLLGDPTLRMFPEIPPRNLQAKVRVSENKAQVSLAWEYDGDSSDLLGFCVYRASSYFSKFEKLTKEPIKETSFIDREPLKGSSIYMARAVRKRKTSSAVIRDYSGGAFAEVFVPDFYAPSSRPFLAAYPNPVKDETKIVFVAPERGKVDIKIFDEEGRLVKTIISGTVAKGLNVFVWDARDEAGRRASSGIWFLKASFAKANLVVKLAINK